MRVLVNAVAARMGGASNYINALARELVQVNNHEFIFVVPNSLADSIRGLAPHIIVLPTNIAEQAFVRRLWFDQVELPRLLCRERIDVLFSSANFATLFSPCRQVLLMRNCLYFSSFYRARILPKKGRRARISEALRRWLARRSLLIADMVLAPSHAMLEELCAAAPLPAAQVSHYGVDRRRFHSLPRPFAQDGMVRLLFTSLYAEHKNLCTLYRAVLQLQSSTEKFRLVTTADPRWEMIHNPIRESDQVLASELESRGLLECTGVLSGAALDQLYSRTDIFVYSSLAESFGHPLVEAMSAGLPIVAADVPVNRELCGDAALYFPPFDADMCASQISQLTARQDLRADLHRKALARAEHFSWKAHTLTLLAAMRDGYAFETASSTARAHVG